MLEGPGKSIECWRRFMLLPIRDQANILHGIRGGLAMRAEIINAVMKNFGQRQKPGNISYIGGVQRVYAPMYI